MMAALKMLTPPSLPLHPQGVRRWVPALRATLPLTGEEHGSPHVKGELEGVCSLLFRLKHVPRGSYSIAFVTAL